MSLLRQLRSSTLKKGNVLYCILTLGLLVLASHVRNLATEVGVREKETPGQERESRKQGVQLSKSSTVNEIQHGDIPLAVERSEPEGYKRAENLRHVCSVDPHFKSALEDKGKVRVSYDPTHKALFCPLCKLASTFWTRVFKMMEINRVKSRTFKTPFDVPISQAPASTQYLNLRSSMVDRHYAGEAFRFLFIRNPYALLFSAYVDKIVGPNPALWSIFGQPGIKIARRTNSKTCGSDLTFTEFLQFVVYTDNGHRPLDCHVAKYGGCKPCAVNYTYVGRMETFKEDTFHILAKLGQSQTLEVFNTTFSEFHVNDAIDDSVSGPFSWKREIIECISWPEALRRIWRKLQIRGVIGASKFPLSDEEALTISKDEFIQTVINTGKKAPSTERSKLKKLSFIEAYRSVPVGVLHGIRKVYSDEFKLFGYDDEPNDIFDRTNTKVEYGFLNYSNILQDIELHGTNTT